MSDLTDSEFNLLDELYFVTSFSDLSQSLSLEKNELAMILQSMLQRELITQLVFNPSIHDFQKLELPDHTLLEQSSFVASKKGLLLHNSRG